jgi:hypothetical protein
MKKNYLLADVQTEIEINVPANSINLSEWVFEMSDKDYQKCAKGHIGAGSSIMPDGKRSSINVESVGGSLLVQHYIEAISKPDHVQLVSERSNLWLYHIFHIHVKVIWEMKTIKKSGSSCIFIDHIRVEHPSLFMKIGSIFGFTRYFIQRHDNEETPKFANDFLNKYGYTDATITKL